MSISREAIEKGDATPRATAFRVATWVLGLVLVVSIAAVVIWQVGYVAAMQERTIEELLAHFRAAGLRVDEPEAIEEAPEGVRALMVNVSGEPVWIYRFKRENPVHREMLRRIEGTQVMEAGGEKRAALVNGPFALAGFEGHTQQDALTRSFLGFGTPDRLESAMSANVCRRWSIAHRTERNRVNSHEAVFTTPLIRTRQIDSLHARTEHSHYLRLMITSSGGV